ncbi:hypothetical protein C8J56DRAFT_1060889 [Mycena floridula]|nr:hypothetical protein C8J56DRAFT_1062231 [Mycena floridula]KAJ7577722.1 hypothetical protein C8J56DRAFT_1060889 [Mycena floridula]
MLSAKFILTAFSTFVTVSAAAAGALRHRSEQISSVIVCIDLPANNCVAIPIIDGTCNNLTEGFSVFNDAISWAQVPEGFICVFFENFDCVHDGVDDLVAFSLGTYDLTQVQGIFGSNFNDLTSSISCSAI